MSDQHEKMTKYLDFPYDTFLMLRFEYELILEDELEVKLLRIIENYIVAERKRIYRDIVNKKGNPEEPLDITRDIWVPISHKLYMSDLFGKVNSANTIKKALNNLVAKKIIFMRFEQKKRYDSPEYTINHSVLQMLVCMTQGYQKLIPSVIEALKKLSPQRLTPSEYQKLIPSEVKLSSIEKLRVSEIDTNFNISNNITNKQDNIGARDQQTDSSASNDATHTVLLQEIKSLKAQLVAAQSEMATLKAQVPPPIVKKEEPAQPIEEAPQNSYSQTIPKEPVTQTSSGVSKAMLVQSERIVRYTEEHRLYKGNVGAPFNTEALKNQQKSQRQRQIDAAVKILERGVSVERYILAYDDRNDEWWNTTKGSVTVEVMAANTPRKIMRCLEILEKLDSRSETVKRPEQKTRTVTSANNVTDQRLAEERKKAALQIVPTTDEQQAPDKTNQTIPGTGRKFHLTRVSPEERERFLDAAFG